MATKDIITSQFVRIEQPTASVGDRIFARLIDCVVLMFYSIGMSVVVAALSDDISAGGEAVLMFLFFVPLLGYTFLCELLTGGYTVGKAVMGTRVVMADGSATGAGALLMRWMFEMVDIMMGCVGLLFIAFTRHHQRIGDLAAGTMVIKTPNLARMRFSLVEFGYAIPGYQPRYPQAQQLSVRQADVIARLVRTPLSYTNEQATTRLANKVAATLRVQPQAPTPRLFLTDILHDYQYYATQIV